MQSRAARLEKYDVQPLRLDMTAHCKPAQYVSLPTPVTVLSVDLLLGFLIVNVFGSKYLGKQILFL